MAKIDDSVKKKVPELRFPGFTDDWEERKLKDIAQFNPKTVLPDEFEYVDLESVVGTEMISHRTESKDQAPSRAQRLAQKGDVFYQTVRPYQMNNYLYDLPYDNYVFSTGYAQMRPNIDSYFLLNSVQNKQFVQHVLDRSTGTSYPAINSSDLSNIEIHVPSKLSEQQKIGAFFQSIDDTIALHQRKLDLLKEQKKGYLQKMFPKNGEKVPELRFAGFTDDWEQRKLSEGTSKIGDGLHGTPNYSDNGDVFFINGNNLVNGKIVITKETKLVTESNQSKDDKLLNMDTILMSINGTIGNLAWYNNERVMLGKSAAYLTVSNFDKKFIFSYLQTSTIKNYFLNNLTGTTIKNLGLKTIRDTTLFVPTLEEQQKIGSLFKQLDDTIALHQRKLDLLKEQKKGYLQKMFPKTGEKIPELRFAGFADDWEERKAKEMIKTHHFRSYLAEPNDVGNYEVIQQGDKPIAGYANGEPFEYFYDVTLFGDHTVSLFKPTKPFFIATDGVKIISADEFDGRYFYVTLERYKPASQGYKRHFTILKNEDIWFTTNKDEQVKIGTFFKQLDDIITLHQRKLDLLKEQKKAFYKRCLFRVYN